jgi:hypothetical protein
MQRINEIPEQLFEWINSRKFEVLNAAERQIVLENISEEEYNDMFKASEAIKAVNSAGEDDMNRKEAVLNSYDRMHSGRRYPYSLNFGAVLKAAAIVVPILGGALFFFLLKNVPNKIINQVAVKDTVVVYRDRTSDAPVIHDTVYRTDLRIVTPASPVAHTQQGESISALNFEEGTSADADIMGGAEESRGSSMKEDTLWRTFPAVSL